MIRNVMNKRRGCESMPEHIQSNAKENNKNAHGRKEERKNTTTPEKMSIDIKIYVYIKYRV